MAQFNEIKSELDFIEATTPVIALTLKPELLEPYLKEPREARAKKLKLKAWKEFDAVLMKDFPSKGYEMIEGTTPITVEGEQDQILTAEKSVVIPKSSFAYVSDLPDRFREQLIAGVRFLDNQGNTMIIPNLIDGMFDSEVDATTDFYEALEQYEVVYNGLLKYAESQQDSTSQLEIEENQTIDEEPEPRNEEPTDKQEPFDDTESLEDIEEPVNVQKPSRAEEMTSEPESIGLEEKLGNELLDKIKEKFQKMELDEVETISENTEEIESVSELKPLLFLAKESINARVNIANKKIESALTEKVSTLTTKAKKMLSEELQRIEDATSLDEENNYTQALKDAEQTLATEQGKIEGAVLQQGSILKQNFERDKKAFIDKEIARLEREYDEKHLPDLQKAEDDFRKESEDKLNTEYAKAVQSIQDQALEQREKAQGAVVDRLMGIMEQDIAENLSGYQEAALSIIDQTKVENESELKETKDKTTEILVRHYANEKEVQNEVEKITENLNRNLEKTKSDLEHYQRELSSSEKQLKIYKESNQKLTEQTESLRSDLTRTREDLAKVLDSKKITDQLETTVGKTSDFSTKKMATIITIAGMACSTIMGATYFVTHGINSASAETQASITRSIDSSNQSSTHSSADKKDSDQKDTSYNAQPTTEFKVGQEVPILVSGNTQMAKVEKIEDQYAVVSTADGNKYRIKALADNE